MPQSPHNDFTIKNVFDKQKILDMANTLRDDKKNNPSQTKDFFKDKYSYLSVNFPDLFDLVYEDPNNHDCIEMLSKILDYASMYHERQMSFDDSSKQAGIALFDKFYTEKKEKNLKKDKDNNKK
jgi:hypothetical protein